MQSHTVKDSNEWKFQKLCNMWTPGIYLFTSRVSDQVPTCVSWKLDPYSKGKNAFQICSTHTKGDASSSFPVIGRALHNGLLDQATLTLITPVWQTQSCYPQLLRILIQNTLILLKILYLLQDSIY